MMKKIYYLCFALLLSQLGIAQITVYPNFNNFETEALCGTSCSGACNLTGTWRNADQYGFAQAGTDWLAEDGSTPSTATGPDIDHTLGTATGKYLYVETSGCNNTTAYLVSAIYNFSALTAPKIKFWYHMFGATMGTMHMDVDTTGLGNWVLNVAPSWTANVNLWQEKTIDLSAYAGRPSIRLRFRGQTGTSFTSDMAIDDVEVFEPVAFDVNMVSVNAGGGCGNSVNTPVVITYSNNGSDTMLAGDTVFVAFQINASVVMDTVILTSNLLPVDTATYTFMNGFADLSGPSNVFIDAWSDYMPDNNAGNDTVSVVTYGIPIITTYPYFQDFELGQDGWGINNNVGGTWAFGTPAKTTINSAGSGVNSFVTGGLGTGTYNNGDNSWVEGPCFDFSNICDPVISLKVWWNAEFSWDGMNITASTDGGTTWAVVGAFGDPLNWYTDNTIVGNPGGSQLGWSGRASSTNGSNGWVTATHRLNGLGNLPNVKLRINFGSDGSVVDDGVAFDDIRITNGAWLGIDQLACSPATVNLSANVGGTADTYLWSTGATTNAITVAATGTYSVALTGPTCTTMDTVYIVVVDSNSAVDLGADTTACGSYTLDAGYWPASTYLWSTGATTETITVTSGATYTVDVVNACGTLSDTIALVVGAIPTVNLGPDTAACGQLVVDAGNPGASYVWNGTPSPLSTILVVNSGPIDVLVTNAAGCTATDTVQVEILNNPTVNLGNDQLLCNGFIALLDAGNPGATFQWSPSGVGQTIVAAAAAAYSVVVTDSNGCIGMDTVIITNGLSPIAGFSYTIGGGGLAYNFTSTSTGASSYAWTFGDGGTSTAANPTHTYAAGSFTATLIVTNPCGSDTITQPLTVVGVQAPFADGSVKVFPNPSNGKFQVSFDLGIADDVILIVQNLAGQVVYTHDLGLVSGQVNEEVQLGNLSAGMYMLRLQSSTAQSTFMLRVE
jgi:MAM domain, meprin/A5/mu/PKD domain/Secretion system C-terminal sorting domain